MNQNQRKRRMTRSLSIVLSLLIVAAICVTVVALASAKRARPSTEETTPQDSGTTASTRPAETTATTGGNTTPVVTPDVTFVSPMQCGNIIKEWSADIPVFSDTMEDYRVHLGVDIEADAGTAVFAAANGKVESVTFDPMMGETIVLSHGGGYTTVYRNLQTKIASGIEAGKTVSAGDVIGYVGDTALVEISELPHLHFEILRDERTEDPLSHVTVTPIDPTTQYED